jgi:CCR4-NOT transcriptional regulation complex NOT5 subunit
MRRARRTAAGGVDSTDPNATATAIGTATATAIATATATAISIATAIGTATATAIATATRPSRHGDPAHRAESARRFAGDDPA